ncbi:hypothetical protein [Rhizobium sp.]|uniref:hypothetical protein n=1 Tax=Rhizobium sp. TaxID=391 RepID=UPI003981EE64
MILLGRLDNDIDDVGETAAAAAAFFHGVVDLRRHDKLPTVFIEKVGDNLPDFLVGYIIAAADKHVFIPNMTLTIVFSAKEDGAVKKKFEPRIIEPGVRMRLRCISSEIIQWFQGDDAIRR